MKYLLILTASFFFIAACTPANPEDVTVPDGNTGTTEITAAEVAQHNSPSDCWMIINGKVYDVTSYVPRHPGGAAEIQQGCGTDATQLFATQGGEGSHSQNAEAILDTFLLGSLAE